MPCATKRFLLASSLLCVLGLACGPRAAKPSPASPPSALTVAQAPPGSPPPHEWIDAQELGPPPPELAAALEGLFDTDPEARAEAAKTVIAAGDSAAPYVALMLALGGSSATPANLESLMLAMGPDAADELAWTALTGSAWMAWLSPRGVWASSGIDGAVPGGTYEAVASHLARCLGSRGLAAVDTTTYTLGGYPLTDGTQRIVEGHLLSPDPVVQLAAVTILAQAEAVSPEAAPHVVALTTHPWPRMRAIAARCLGAATSEPDIVVPALTALLEDDSYRVRGAAVLSLRSFDRLPRDTEAPLLAFREYPLPVVRALALALIPRLEEPSATAAQAADGLVEDADGNVGIVAAAVRGVLSQDIDGAVRAVIERAAEVGEGSSALLRGGRIDARSFDAAISVLGQAAAPSLIDLLADERPEAVTLAVRGLRVLGGSAEEALMGALASGENLTLPTEVLTPWPLADAESLVRLLDAPSESVREAAIVGLGRLRAGTVTPQCPDVLSGSDRWASVYGAPHEGLREGLQAVYDELLDVGTDPALRAAAGMLWSVSPQPESLLAALVSDHSQLQVQAITVMLARKRTEPELRAALEAVFEGGDEEARLAAACALARDGQHPESVTHVVEVLDSTSDRYQRLRCIESLSRPGAETAAALDALERAVERGVADEIRQVCILCGQLSVEAAPLAPSLIEFATGQALLRTKGPGDPYSLLDSVGRALAATGPEGIDAALKRLPRSRGDSRIRLLVTLGVALSHLPADGPDTVAQVDRALAATATAGAPLVETLVNHLADDAPAPAREAWYIGRALACGGEAAGEALLTRLPDASAEAQASLSWALREMAPHSAATIDALKAFVASQPKLGQPSEGSRATTRFAEEIIAQAEAKQTELPPNPWQRLRLRWEEEWEERAIGTALLAKPPTGTEAGWMPEPWEIEPRPVPDLEALLESANNEDRLRGLRAVARLGWQSDSAYRERVIEALASAEAVDQVCEAVLATAPPRLQADLLGAALQRGLRDRKSPCLEAIRRASWPMSAHKGPSWLVFADLLPDLRARATGRIPLAMELAWLGDDEALTKLLQNQVEGGTLESYAWDNDITWALGADGARLAPILLTSATDATIGTKRRVEALRMVGRLACLTPADRARLAALAEDSEDKEVARAAGEALNHRGGWLADAFDAPLWFDIGRARQQMFSSSGFPPSLPLFY